MDIKDGTYKITVLGCGNSAGVPSVGNYWGHCDPNEPKNRRTRPGLAVQSAHTTIIVDTGPDFRDQLNREDINRVDAVLFTHAHGDHIHGIDDLRPLRFRQSELIPAYGNRPTMEELIERFAYLFEIERLTFAGTKRAEIYPQVIKAHFIEEDMFGQSFTLGDIDIVPFEQDHGTCQSVGYRFGDLAYSTDVVRLDDAALQSLKGVRTWIVDAAGYKMEHNMVHFTLRQAIAMNEIVQAEHVYLTHMPGFMDYRTLCRELPDGFAPCYDGLVLEARAN